MIQQDHKLSKTRRCELLSIPRSSSYYQPKPMPEADLALMELIDRYPYGQTLSGLQAHRGRAGRARPEGRPETCAAPDAADGYPGNSPGAEDVEATSSAQDISLPAAKPGYQSSQPGLGERRDVHPDGVRVCLPDGHPGLV